MLKMINFNRSSGLMKKTGIYLSLRSIFLIVEKIAIFKGDASYLLKLI